MIHRQRVGLAIMLIILNWPDNEHLKVVGSIIMAICAIMIIW